MRMVALLRAINVGGHNVKMAHLRELFEALGLAGVETFIASGNVLFDSTPEQGLEERIERHLHNELGYEVATFVRTVDELGQVAGWRAPSAGESLYVAFLKKPAAAGLLAPFATPTDEFHGHGREIYWLCRGRMSDSKFSGARLEKALGQPSTMRNWTTVSKLAQHKR